MTPVTGTIEISRPPQDVFDYVGDPSRNGEWQSALVDVQVETEGPTKLGTTVKETRLVPGGKQSYHYEITEWEPPRVSAFTVVDGPVRPKGSITFTPLDDGTRTRVDFEIEFHGHGFGKLIVPLAARDARKHVPNDLAALKARCESQN
jgi:uncharacterized protein YndB with AHSA1/START domain